MLISIHSRTKLMSHLRLICSLLFVNVFTNITLLVFSLLKEGNVKLVLFHSLIQFYRLHSFVDLWLIHITICSLIFMICHISDIRGSFVIIFYTQFNFFRIFLSIFLIFCNRTNVKKSQKVPFFQNFRHYETVQNSHFCFFLKIF